MFQSNFRFGFLQMFRSYTIVSWFLKCTWIANHSFKFTSTFYTLKYVSPPPSSRLSYYCSTQRNTIAHSHHRLRLALVLCACAFAGPCALHSWIEVQTSFSLLVCSTKYHTYIATWLWISQPVRSQFYNSILQFFSNFYA